MRRQPVDYDMHITVIPLTKFCDRFPELVKSFGVLAAGMEASLKCSSEHYCNEQGLSDVGVMGAFRCPWHNETGYCPKNLLTWVPRRTPAAEDLQI